MGALASKIEGAARSQEMSKTMANTIPALTSAMKQMDAQGIGKNVANFEKIFEDMEVKTGEIDASLENVYAASISQEEVGSLLSEIQGVQSIEADGQMMDPSGQRINNPNAAQNAAEVDSIQNSLDQLKNI